MDLATMSNGNNVTKTCHFFVLGQLDAVGLVQPGYFLRILTVVHQFEFCEKDNIASRQDEGKGELRPQGMTSNCGWSEEGEQSSRTAVHSGVLDQQITLVLGGRWGKTNYYTEVSLAKHATYHTTSLN